MWQSLEVTGRSVDLLENSGDRPLGALVYLHDQDGWTLRDDPSATEFLVRNRLACLCPHGGLSWWSNRICASFHPKQSAERWLLDEVVPSFEQRWLLSSKVIALAGVGMGGQGALRLAFKYPERFAVVTAIDAAIDHYEMFGEGGPLDEMYPSREHCRQDSAGLHIHPARQPASIWFAADPRSRWFRGNDRLHEKLMALGVAHTFEVGTAGMPALLSFLREALEQQSRRLL